jgi:hypothetical protein
MNTAAEYAEMESAGAMHVRMQGNMQYVFHDVCHIQIITYFYGWWIVLEALGPWCLPDKKLVVPREKLERQMLFFSPLMTMVEVVYRGIHERGISEFLFTATHCTHCNKILKIIITESTMALSSVSLTLKQKIFANLKNVFFE